jgi:hypothetical protein
VRASVALGESPLFFRPFLHFGNLTEASMRVKAVRCRAEELEVRQFLHLEPEARYARY